ncbi:hypothetical protein VPMS16_920 [Vibrio sp. 16]|nr:hypothetical protein VPMS16_920 [Vibrio sp. 16]
MPFLCNCCFNPLLQLFRTAAHMGGFFVAAISFNKGVGIQGNLS